MSSHKAVAVSAQRWVGPELFKHLAGKALADAAKRKAA
jgi:hypothetical protein